MFRHRYKSSSSHLLYTSIGKDVFLKLTALQEVWYLLSGLAPRLPSAVHVVFKNTSSFGVFFCVPRAIEVTELSKDT